MIELRHRHLLWDWNGTLLDDLELCVDIVNKMLARRSLPTLDRAGYHATFDFPVRSFYERIGFDLSGDQFAELSREFIGEFDARRLEAGLHVGVAELLARVRASGRQQSILSAHRQATLHEIVALRGIEAHFVHMAGLDDAHAHGKIERGRALVAELGHRPDELVLIGDTLHDLEVARALGIDCVLVANGHHAGDRLRAAGATVVDRLADLRLFP
jgi:phosphoglycolate phosphatase